MPKILADYITIWDDSLTIVSPCMYNSDSNTVSDISAVDIEGVDVLTREYIELEDGTKIEIEDLTERPY